MDEKLTQFINMAINRKLNSMANMVTPNHAHNSYDSNQLDPAIALLGFPVIQVQDATVSPLVGNPNDKPGNGTFRFYVDRVPVYRLWAYLTYKNASGALVGSWRYFTLT